MSISAICSHCKKTISVDKRPNLSCPECGGFVNLLILQRHGLIIDKDTEKAELAAATDYFKNAEFLGASEHFKKALKANKNSYIAQYFVNICEIYLNETGDVDVIECAVNAVCSALKLMTRAGITLDEKQRFVTAMLGEIKIIIVNSLNSYDELYDYDIAEYRAKIISELKKALALFKTDGEAMMIYLPNVSRNMLEIADTAIALCHKAVQTVAIGAELYHPTSAEYSALTALCNEFNAYAVSMFNDYDMRKYVPDFTQCDLLNENVESRLQKFDAANKSNAKKYLVGDIDEYNSILKDCEKAVEFIYRVCFKSMCDTANAERHRMLLTGLRFTVRLITPRIVAIDKKRVQIFIGNNVEVEELCGVVTQFLQAVSQNGNSVAAQAVLREYYARLYDALDTYFTPEHERYSKRFNKIKSDNGGEYAFYERFMFACAICAAPSLSDYIKYVYKDKNRARLVKLCKSAAEAFLLLRDYDVTALEQSNFHRPILDVYNSVMRETGA